MKGISLFSLAIFFISGLYAQSVASLSGIVVNKQNLQPIAAASISLQPGTKGTVTDAEGRFRITNIPAGTYTVVVSALNFSPVTKFNIVLTSGNETNISTELDPIASELANVTVKSNSRTVRAATLETPLSVQRLTREEIKSNPGGNFDISRVVQSLPGVGGTAGSVGGFRNDIIIRGGAPNENVYYLDGIEIPNINHFSTQGSAGGPTGILNVSFIEDVKLNSSAFDSRFDNTLSSVFEFRQKRGSLSRTQGNVRLSATELAATLEGPLSKKSQATYLASVRRSYLQFLFKALDLPIRPNYWDFQFKATQPLSKTTTLTFLGVGAIDEFSFAAPKEATPEKLYVLNSNPAINQNSYTVGASLRHLINDGYWNLSLSNNGLDNRYVKYENNLGPDKGAKTLDYYSKENETKLRFDVNRNFDAFKFSYGAVAQFADYSNNTYSVINAPEYDGEGNIISPAITSNYNSSINFAKFGAFVQAGKRVMNNRLGISAGIRTDMNTFTDDGMNPLKTFSPRVALSYVLADKWTLNASAGTYYKIAPYTILGFRDNAGELVNKDAKYINSTHYVAGVEYLKSNSTRFTLEGFYKQYQNVPVSIRNGISLSNLGGDFTVLGNEDIVSTGNGRAYGFEFFAQQKLTKRFFGVFSYTFFISEYSGANGKYIESAWNNKHLLSFTWGYKFNHNWELGLKFRFQGGAPYTPFDDSVSRANYLTLGTGTYDYAVLNTLKLTAFNASDVRIDKKINFRKTTIDIFLDVQNWYVANSPSYPSYTFKRNADNTDFVTTDGQPVQKNGANAIPLLLQNNDPQVTPTIGFIWEF